MSIRHLASSLVSSARRLRKLGALALVAGGLAACVGGPVVREGSGGGGNAGDGPVQVALLVPYGSARGTDGNVARSLENAARLAVRDLAPGEVTVTVYATQGTPGGATGATATALTEGAQVILGPLYAENAAAAGVAAAGSGVPVLSFSNNTGVAGGNVWVLGSTFENTANRLLAYAAAQGRNRVLVTHSDQAAGRIANAAVISAARGSGAQITGSAAYPLSQEGIAARVPAIAAQARSTGSNAIFLTGNTAGDLPVISQLLVDAGIGAEEFRFLGLTRWDVPAEAVQLPGLQGGYFALPAQGPLQQFQSRYRSVNGSEPHPIANLAYDGIAAVGAIASQGQTVGRSTLTAGSGFAGTGGPFRLRGDGTIQRALAVAQIVDRQVRIVSPAPRSFGGAGS